VHAVRGALEAARAWQSKPQRVSILPLLRHARCCAAVSWVHAQERLVVGLGHGDVEEHSHLLVLLAVVLSALALRSHTYKRREE
jgi:hypothetical protein